MKQSATRTPLGPRIGKTLVRWFLKTFIFGILTAFVLNPNLKIAFKQIKHTFQPEALIQPNFPDIPSVNSQIDQWISRDAGRHSEIKIVERFVYRSIKYVSDYENWSNVEYWPTAEEVWNKRQEDCDGRAILAASILRSRGYSSAKLVVGLHHMWVTVNENEKEPNRPANMVALLNPETKLSLEIGPKPGPGHFMRLAKALVQPTALRETGAGIIADIPNIRKAILALLLVVIWFLPLPAAMNFRRVRQLA